MTSKIFILFISFQYILGRWLFVTIHRLILNEIIKVWWWLPVHSGNNERKKNWNEVCFCYSILDHHPVSLSHSFDEFGEVSFYMKLLLDDIDLLSIFLKMLIMAKYDLFWFTWIYFIFDCFPFGSFMSGLLNKKKSNK